MALIVGAALVALLAAAVFGDPTEPGAVRGVGADANFGKDRGPVQPVVIEPFEQVKRLSDRELGRIVQLTGTTESVVRRAAVYVRTPSGRRILVRFEPTPTPEQLRAIVYGGGMNVTGYLMKISRAEFNVWMDTLGVVIPRPKPGVKFGDLPDSNFMRVDSLFIKDYYVSVRPEGIGRPGVAPPVAQAARPATRADSARPGTAAPATPSASDAATAPLPRAAPGTSPEQGPPRQGADSASAGTVQL
ncbi:MAG TPA: hypothetical protein VFS20_07900 [Longimicrobium sp.]|nr:hypothetical protein [Longimicrobium sp.]